MRSFGLATGSLITVLGLCLATQRAPAQQGADEKPAADKPADQEVEASQKKKPLKRERVQLRIVADPELNIVQEAIINNLAFDRSVLNAAITLTSPEAGKAAAAGERTVEVGPIMPPSGDGLVHSVSVSNGSALLDVEVRFYDERVAPDKFLPRYAGQLQNRLGGLDARHHGDENQLGRLEEEEQRLDLKLRIEKASFTKLASLNQMSVSPEVNEQRRARIESEFETIEVEIAGLEARQKVLEIQIATIGANAEANAAKDPVVEELEKAVDLRAKTVARLKTLIGTNSIPEAAVRDGELALVAAKAELAKYRREATQGGNQRLAELRRRLDDTAIDLAETAAKRTAVNVLRHKLPQFNAELESKRLRIEQIEFDYRAVSADLSAVKSRLRSYMPPSVDVFQRTPVGQPTQAPAAPRP